jgi:hypothetical protein
VTSRNAAGVKVSNEGKARFDIDDDVSVHTLNVVDVEKNFDAVS